MLNLEKHHEVRNRSSSYCRHRHSRCVSTETAVFFTALVLSRSFDALNKDLSCWIESDFNAMPSFLPPPKSISNIKLSKDINKPCGKPVFASRLLWQFSLVVLPAV